MAVWTGAAEPEEFEVVVTERRTSGKERSS